MSTLDSVRIAPSIDMRPHPVTLRVEPPAQLDRVHVLVRLTLLAALGTVGCSSVYWLLYLALPALASLRISQKGPRRYMAEDGPRIARVLRWFAAAYAYLWLLTDAFPTNEGDGPAQLEVEPCGSPSASAALGRLVSSLPALLVLAVLSLAAAFLWPVGAFMILVRRRIPAALHDFIAQTLCYQFRLFAYHLSVVDQYPAFGVCADTPRPSNMA